MALSRVAVNAILKGAKRYANFSVIKSLVTRVLFIYTILVVGRKIFAGFVIRQMDNI